MSFTNRSSRIHTVKESGHLHVAGLGFFLLLILAIYLFGQWYRKIYYMHEKLVQLHTEVQKLDDRVRRMELKLQFGTGNMPQK